MHHFGHAWLDREESMLQPSGFAAVLPLGSTPGAALQIWGTAVTSLSIASSNRSRPYLFLLKEAAPGPQAHCIRLD